MVPVVVVRLKVTFFVVLLVGFTRSALAVFKIDIGCLVDMVDRVDADDPAVVTAGGCNLDCFCAEWFNVKPGLGARLWLFVFGPL